MTKAFLIALMMLYSLLQPINQQACAATDGKPQPPAEQATRKIKPSREKLLPNNPGATKSNQNHRPPESPHRNEQLAINKPIAPEYLQQSVFYAEKLSNYTFWLVFATAVLAVVGIVQLFNMIFTYMLQKRTFFATHRPKLIIRRIVVEFDKKGEEGKNGIFFVIYNVGNTDAHIIEYLVHTKPIKGALPPTPQYRGYEMVKTDILVRPGSTQEMKIGMDRIEAGLMEMIGRTRQLVPEMLPEKMHDEYLVGYINYRDNNGNIRQTAFCRKYDFGTKRFTRVDDPDYEYAD
ncbi:MAG: hypothetical protein KKB57_16545 [Proteobacteria bacterium]|nr:hypothetical protein [Pseudomonadota bacterium]